MKLNSRNLALNRWTPEARAARHLKRTTETMLYWAKRNQTSKRRKKWAAKLKQYRSTLEGRKYVRGIYTMRQKDLFE